MCSIAPSSPSTTRQRNDGIEIFLLPIRFACGGDAGIGRKRRRIAAHGAAGIEKRLHDWGEMARRDRPVDEQRLGGPAHAGTAKFRIQGDLAGHAEIGAGMHVDVTYPFEMGEDRHAGLFLHPFDEALAAARHDDVDRAVEAGKQGADRAAIARRDEGDRLARQPCPFKAGNQGRVDRLGGAEACRSRAQDRGVARLQAKRARIRRHIRPAFEDHADDAKRRRHALDDEAIRSLEARGDAPDRIGKRRDLLERLCHREDARFIETQTIEEALGRGFPLRLLHVARIGREDQWHLLSQRSRHGEKGRVLLLRGRQRDFPRGGASPSAERHQFGAGLGLDATLEGLVGYATNATRHLDIPLCKLVDHELSDHARLCSRPPALATLRKW